MNKLLFSLGFAICLLSACGSAEKKADTSAAETTNAVTVASESKTQEAATTPTTTSNSTTAATGNDNPDLAYLRKLAGQYPFDAKLVEKGALKGRLEKLLGGRMTELTGCLQTSPPIEIKGDILFAEGCMAHACSINEAAVCVDLKQGSVHACILNDGTVTCFSESGTTKPQALIDWEKSKDEN